jgi:hypothetical protein
MRGIILIATQIKGGGSSIREMMEAAKERKGAMLSRGAFSSDKYREQQAGAWRTYSRATAISRDQWVWLKEILMTVTSHLHDLETLTAGDGTAKQK